MLSEVNSMALRISCLIHGVLLLLVSGCSAHRAVTTGIVLDSELSAGKDFVAAVADKMPLWDADAISRYERVEIATVKADIAMAQQEDERGEFLEYVSKLRHDWGALVALDEALKEEQII
jgi:hypothetical protein